MSRLELINLLKSVDCKVLQYGNNKANIEYYYCNCDPNENEAICSVCANICHKGHKLSEIHFGEESCKCGKHCHRKFNISKFESYEYNPRCFFHYWSIYSKKFIYYLDGDNIICLFCSNFCKEKKHSMVKVFSVNIPECMCKHSNHDDMLTIIGKINQIVFLDNYDFDNLIIIQMFNLIFISTESFNNLYLNFILVLDNLKKNLKKKDFNLDIHFQYNYLAFALNNFTTLINSIKHFYYFNNKVKNIFDIDFILDLFMKNVDNSIVNFWKFKAKVITIFHKVVFMSDFRLFPIFKVKDIMNLNPLIRLLLSSNITGDVKIINKYIKRDIENTKQLNFVDSLIIIIENFISNKLKHKELYIIIHKIYSMIKVLAKYNLLETQQIIKICRINDEVIFYFSEHKLLIKHLERSEERDKLFEEIEYYEIRIMICMVKTLIFIVFYSNDKQVEKYLNDEISLDQVKFFHLQSGNSKGINKNLINLLDFSKTLYDKDNNNCLNLIPEYKKKMKKILDYALSTISFTINYPDTYIFPLFIMLKNDKAIYLRYLKNNYDLCETQFLEFIRNETIIVEECYSAFYECRCLINDMKNTIKESLIKFFKFTNTLNYNVDIKRISKTNSKFKVKPDEGINKFEENSNILYDTYRILMNKSFYQFSIIKIMKILFFYELNKEKQKIDSNLTRIDLEEELFNNILTLLYFYTDKNPDNCMVILSFEFAYIFNYINSNNFEKLIDFYLYCLATLRENSYKFSTNYTVFEIMKRIIFDIMNSRQSLKKFIPKLLRLLKYFLEIPSIEMRKSNQDLKSLLIMIYPHENVIINFKNLLTIRNQNNTTNFRYSDKRKINLDDETQTTNFHLQDEKRDLITKLLKNDNELNSKSINKSFKNENDEKDDIIKLIRFKNNNPLPKKLEPISKTMANIIHQKGDKPVAEQLRKNNYGDDDDETDSPQSFKRGEIFIRFIKLINHCFEIVSNVEESKFLKSILTLNEISDTLKDFELSIDFRIQLLKFYQLAYFNLIVEQRDINQYVSLFMIPISLTNESNEEFESLTFMEKSQLIYKNELNLNHHFNIIRLELKYFNVVLSNNQVKFDCEIFISYIEEGIIYPLFHFLNLFLSKIYVYTGYQYLQLYEILYYFLNLKFFLYKNKSYLEKFVENEDKNYFSNFGMFNKNKKYLLTKCKFHISDFYELEKDMEEIRSEKFEILNYKIILAKLNKHLFNFINNHKSQSLNDYFTENNNQYSQEKIDKLRYKLEEFNCLKTPFENKSFNLVIKYENDKQILGNSDFIKCLSEINQNHQKSFRFLLLKMFIFLISLEKKSEKFIKQILFNIVRLLQTNTQESQDDLKIIFSEVIFYDNKKLIERLIIYLMIIFFKNWDLSISKINEDYMLAVIIVKILKYLCEEHNNYFQRMMFEKIKLNYIPDSLKTMKECSLFDFMLSVVMKIIIVAKWETVNFEKEEETLSYFYDIFFVIIELLIEMVQGTKKEYLEIIADNINKNENSVFITFLKKIRKLLLSNQNDSQCLYRVRRVLIDFIMCFLEEKNTPAKLIFNISSIFNPFQFIDTIGITMKKIFIKYKIKEEKQKLEVSEYKNYNFNSEMYRFFNFKYFHDSDFLKLPEFEFSNRMFQYIKLLALEFNNYDAITITNSLSNIIIYDEQINKSSKMLDIFKLSNFYYCIKFFEDITRSVYIFKEEETVRVLFSINPLTIFLTNSAKVSFENYVNRETRYSKISFLLESCHYFQQEMLYNYDRSKRGFLSRFFININYQLIETLMFSITLIINLFMILFLKLDDDDANSLSSSNSIHVNLSASSIDLSNSLKSIMFPSEVYYRILQYIAIINILVNFSIIICWLFNKYPLNYCIEKKKYLLLNINLKSIRLLEEIKIRLLYSILYRNEINCFIWNIIFSSLGVYSTNHIYLYTIQMLCIINLSSHLKNTVKAVTLKYKSLILTWLFLFMTIFIFACFGYFVLFNNWEIDNGIGFCRTLIGCFLDNLNLGLRHMGGAGDFLIKYKLSDNSNYISIFLYSLLYKIICIVIDTFAQLRENTNITDNDIANICFICGDNRNDLEKKDVNFEFHVNHDHNLWNYAHYIIGLKFTDPHETNAVNSYVIGMIETNNIKWIPAFKKITN